MAGNSLRNILREATHASHERLDAVMSRLELSQRDGYASFIAVHAAILDPLEQAMEEAGVATLLPDWPARTRRAAIAEDARALGLDVAPVELPELDMTPAGLAGLLYVLEGSRLGNAMLVREARRASEPLPVAFMEHGHGNSLWPVFVKWLDTLPLDAPAEAAATGSALGLFGLYQCEADRRVPGQGVH